MKQAPDWTGPSRRTTAIANAARDASHHTGRFSLTIGGPLYGLYRRVRLLDPPVELLERRLVAVVALAWLPLLLLSLVDGTTVTGARVPFVLDLGVHSRLLLALPMMIAAEPAIHRSFRLIVRQFVDRALIAQNDLGHFQRLIDVTVRMRNSVVAEAAIFGFSTMLAYWLRRDHWPTRPGMWYLGVDADGHAVLDLAGWWYSLVSLNLFRFVVLRWCYRLAIWYWFLWRTSRLSLRLNPLHPDRAGGLAFLEWSLTAFTPVFVAQAIAVAGEIGSRVLQDGMSLSRFQLDLLGFPLILAVVAALPLAFFSPRLVRSGFHGVMDYGTLSSRYVDEFRNRYMSRHARRYADILGSADIQSLADLANAYDVPHGIRAYPAGARALLVLIVVNALPFLPLALTVIPLKELIHRLAGVLL